MKIYHDGQFDHADELRQDTRQDQIAFDVALRLRNAYQEQLDDQQSEEQYNAEWRAWLDRWHG